MGTTKYKESAKDTFYHLYNRGNQKKEIFLDDLDYLVYLKLLRRAKNKFGFSVLAYCLMPNHLHLLVKQNQDFPPASLISSLHTSYVMFFNDKHRLVGHLFQDRYKQKIIDNNEYLQQLIAYIHLNPVEDKLCHLPKEYPWSSHREHFLFEGQSASHEDHPIISVCDQDLITRFSIKELSYESYTKSANNIAPYDAFDDIS
jgi:REP element-mobilizing transposase RayT